MTTSALIGDILSCTLGAAGIGWIIGRAEGWIRWYEWWHWIEIPAVVLGTAGIYVLAFHLTGLF